MNRNQGNSKWQLKPDLQFRSFNNSADTVLTNLYFPIRYQTAMSFGILPFGSVGIQLSFLAETHFSWPIVFHLQEESIK